MNKKPKAGRIALAFLLVILVLIVGLWLMKYAGGYLAAAGLGISGGAIVGLIVGGYLPSYTLLEIRKTMVADKEDK
jgi:hypothetical protein